MHNLPLPLFCAILLLALLAAALSRHAVAAGDDILIGQSASLSGFNARTGMLYSEGAQLHFDAVNDAGGIFGRRLRVTRLDDRGRPQQARANTRRLIEGGSIVALFGYSGPLTSKASLPLARAAGVPFFAPRWSSHSLLSPADSRILFTLRASRREELRFLARRLTAAGLRRVALVHGGDDAGAHDVALAAQLLHEAGGLLLAGVALERRAQDEDATETADAVMRHRPDAVLLSGDVVTSAALVRALRRRQYPGLFYGLSHLGPVAFREMLGEDGDGVALLQTVPFPWQARSALAVEYRRIAESRGSAPSFTGLEGYLAAKVLCEGLRRAGPDPTPEKLVRALESINEGNYDAGDFRLNFSAANHHGSSYLDMSAISRAGGFLN